MPKRRKSPIRIVLTGGPGGGKSTVAQLFHQGCEGALLVPEAATLVFSMGFPRGEHAGIKRHCQRAIYHFQRNLEDAHAATGVGRVLLCDRGTLDGVAYWPGTPESFLKDVRSSLAGEFARYDAVVFMETVAVGGISIRGGNPHRNESIEEACRLDRRLKRVWQRHGNFFHVPHDNSFEKKLERTLGVLFEIVREIVKRRGF